MDEAAGLWTTCSESLQMQVSDAMWQAWFAGLVAEGIEDDTLALSTPNALVRERIEDRYKGLIEGVLHDTHRGVDKVRLEVRRPSAHREEYDVPQSSTVSTPSVDDAAPGTGTAGGPADHTTAASPASAPSATAPASTAASGFPPAAAPAAASTNGGRPPAPALSPRYTFDAFVIGATNRFAHAAAQRVAEKPAASYNPLFIHGDSGLGKTHLLHAIGHYVADNFPSATVRYVSTETFLNDFVDAIRTNGQFGFKRRYREIDVLLVDDIQFMEGKEGLQEEFFHTFNSLYEGERQIVLSSDRHPRNIATLEDRLRSRFEWGLITDVQPPDLETRLAILRKKAESERVPIPADVLEMIATHVKDNIRELEGALIRVSAYASLNAEPLTIAVAEQVLSDILAAGRPRQITPPVILKATSEMFELSIDEICGTSRRRPLVNARQIGMYVFRELTDMSYPAIAREFGGRDHTTVIHAVEKVSRLMMERRQTYDQVTELIRTIKGATS